MIASLRLGGAERQLSGLALMLHTQGHEVEVLTYREGNFYAKLLEGSGVKLSCIPKRGGAMRLIDDIAEHLRESGCEVLISYLRGANIKACLVKRKCPGLKVVVSERNCDKVMLPHTAFRLSCYRLADAVVCNSYAQEAFVRSRRPALAPKLTAIPNYVDSELFCPPVERRTPDGVLHIVTSARLNRRKNALGLIRAVAEAGCDKLQFEWYGAYGSDSYSRRCLRLARRLGVDGQVHFLPASNNIKDIYTGADAFFLPSFYEGTSNAMAEALSCGLPAVCSDVSDNARYIIPGHNGLLFNPKNIGSIVSALRKLASMSPAELEEWGRNSRRIAVGKLSKKDFLARYTALLEKL